MKENRQIFQPLNLIVFLLFSLVAEVAVCLPLFEDANVLLQIAWTCYLLLGMVFLFFVGGKIAAAKSVEKYLGDSEKGRFWLGLLLFFLCIGFGAAFRLREIIANSGTVSASDSLKLLFYLGVGFLVFYIGQQISGFGGAVAVTILLTLCPLFDFSVELSAGACFYTLLFLGAILFVLLTNHSLDVREPGWQDFLLTILGASALAGATFLHLSAVAALLPCMLFLIRKSGLKKKDKKERRILRCFLFVAFYACVTAVIYLVYTLSLQNNAWVVKLPVDYELFHALGAIGREPGNALIALFEKFSSLFTTGEQAEYYNGLLMGMLLFGLIRAILLFKNKVEKKHFPVYLFNCFFLVSILSEEFASSKLLLFVLLECIAAGTVADLAEAVISRKHRKLKEEAEAYKAQEEKEIEEKKIEEKKIEEQSLERKAEPILLEMKSEKEVESESGEVPESAKEIERIELGGDAEKGETVVELKAEAEPKAETVVELKAEAEQEADAMPEEELIPEADVLPEAALESPNVMNTEDVSLEAALEGPNVMDTEDVSLEAALEGPNVMDTEDVSLEAALENPNVMDTEDVSLEAALENPNVMDTEDVSLEAALESPNVMDTEDVSLEIALENPNAIDTEDTLFETVPDDSNLSDTDDELLEMALENLPQSGPEKIIELEYVDLDDEQEMPDVSKPERNEEAVRETVKTESEAIGTPVVQMEKQIQELLNREEMLMEIMENQSVQISKLTQELREQRMMARKRERHYRQQFAITKNNRSLLKGKGEE